MCNSERVSNCTGTLCMENTTSAIANIMTMHSFVTWKVAVNWICIDIISSVQTWKGVDDDDDNNNNNFSIMPYKQQEHSLDRLCSDLPVTYTCSHKKQSFSVCLNSLHKVLCLSWLWKTDTLVVLFIMQILTGVKMCLDTALVMQQQNTAVWYMILKHTSTWQFLQVNEF
jgi:uncharacterized protein YbdZ (MbtH family)